MLWPMVLHCQFPKRYQPPTESRITWDSHGKWSLTMGWMLSAGVCLSSWLLGEPDLVLKVATYLFTEETNPTLVPSDFCHSCTALEQHQKKLPQMNLPAIAPDALPNHASSQQPELVLVFLWIQGALLLPLRDTQLGILHCPWWFLLGQDWSHGGQVQSFALANSPAAPTSPEVFLPSNMHSHT